MSDILGSNNTIVSYIFMLLVYGGLVVAMRQAATRIEPEFKRTFWVLYVVWAIGVFVSNYLFFRIGIMSFLPWLDNFLHSFVWIGLGLGFLYAISYKRPMWQQLVLCGVYSLAVKMTENKVLGTWDFSHFFFIDGNLAYVIGWSVVDAFFPIASIVVLWIASRFITGLIVPELNPKG